MKIKYFTYINMCSILYKCEVPGKDLLKNTVKIRKEKKKSSLA